MAKVELGAQTGQQDIELDELRRLWRHLDESGFDWISVWDHFYESPPRDGAGICYEALTAMTALALETQRCRVACLVFCMTYRNPAMLAKAITTLDHLSHGRVSVGVGAGWHEPEHTGYGFTLPPVGERMDRLSEGIRVMRSMLTHERTDFDGKYFTVRNAANYPQPVQARVPIIVGGAGEQRTLRIAARRADGWNLTYQTPEVFASKGKVLDEWCERYDRDPATVERSVNLHFLMSSKTGEASAPRPTGSLFGEPQQVIDRIGEYVDAGAARINVAIRPPIDWDALQSYIEDVMPAFR
jgi:F420-dependent oxidoreductase-like protein